MTSDKKINEKTGCANKTSVLPSLWVRLEMEMYRTTIMKESTVQSEKMLDIAKERHAV